MSVTEYSVCGSLSEQQLAVEQRLQDAQVTRGTVDFPGLPQIYPWTTPPSWGPPYPVSTTDSSPGSDDDHLIQAIQDGDTRKVRNIVASVTTPRSLVGPHKDGWTPLHEATYYGQTECLKILLAAAPRMINNKTSKHQTPLILAVSRGHLSCMKYLLERGADPRIHTKSNETPLYEACATLSVDMVLLLLRYGADVSQKCLDGWTVLHEAVLQNHLEICEILIDNGAMVSTPNPYGMTPLFLAAQCGHVEVLKFLVNKGADINSEAKDGSTALYEACKNGHTEIVKFLLSQGADADRPGKGGLLPLHMAVKGGNDGIVSMLIPSTSRTKIQCSGLSPLHLAAEDDKDEVLELLIQAGFGVNALLSLKRSCMYEDRRLTALYFAVDSGNIEAATMLLEAGADPNLDPFNPLLLAVRKDHGEMATLLMEHGANVNASIPTHPSAFPACVMLSVKNLSMLKCLMDHGCDAAACFHCEYGVKQHSNMDFMYTSCELHFRSWRDTHSCLQFCEMISHPKVCHLAGPIIDMLLDYVGYVKLCSRLNKHLENCKSWTHIKEKSKLPKSLMQLCRLRIRQLLGTERLQSISTLALPGRLIKYLKYEQHIDTL